MQWFLKVSWVDWAEIKSIIHCELLYRHGPEDDFIMASSDLTMSLYAFYYFYRKMVGEEAFFDLEPLKSMVVYNLDNMGAEERRAILLIVASMGSRIPKTIEATQLNTEREPSLSEY